MNADPVVDVCPNCGAPWEPDEGGTCRWCHAHIRVEPSPASLSEHSFNPFAYPGNPASLVPDGVDDCMSSAPFIGLILATFSVLSKDRAVQGYAQSEPGLRERIQALTTAVSGAGVRVRDAGLLEDSFDESLGVYTPEEIWLFDLAIDVIAMLSIPEGMVKSTRALVAEDLRNLDEQLVRHKWVNALKQAGEGPDAFRELRAEVPRHIPHPAQ
jgi:hypothetical protein